MGNFMIRTFHKSKAIRCMVHYPEKRARMYWAIPKDGNVKINNLAWTINDQDFSLFKGIPLYTFNTTNAEPVQVFTEQHSLKTAQDFDTAISAQVATEIFIATHPKTMAGLFAIILSMITIVAVVVVAYFLNQKIDIMQDQLQKIYDAFGVFGGY